jgi:hypothetical protein
MAAHVMLARPKDGEGNDAQRKQRQKVDGAPLSPGSDCVDEERRSRHQNHEKRPRPADRSMRKRSLWGQQLHSAETDRREGESGVKPYNCRRIEQRGEGHDRVLAAEIHGLDREVRTPKRAWP